MNIIVLVRDGDGKQLRVALRDASASPLEGEMSHLSAEATPEGTLHLWRLGNSVMQDELKEKADFIISFEEEMLEQYEELNIDPVYVDGQIVPPSEAESISIMQDEIDNTEQVFL